MTDPREALRYIANGSPWKPQLSADSVVEEYEQVAKAALEVTTDDDLSRGFLVALTNDPAAPQLERQLDEAFDNGVESVLGEIVCSVCGENHDRDESAACEGCVPLRFDEWVESVRRRCVLLIWNRAEISHERPGDTS